MADKKEVASSSDVYEVYLGTFNDNKFTWYSVSKHKDIVEAYKAYKKYVNTQLKYTDEELKKVWDTGRLDVELRQGNKLLNWTGIYSRKVTELTREEEKEAEEGKSKKKDKDDDKKSKKDSMPVFDSTLDEISFEVCDGISYKFVKDEDTYKFSTVTPDSEVEILSGLTADEAKEIYNDTIHKCRK